MKKILSEKGLVLVLFVFALVIFSIANEDAKKLGVLQNSVNTPVRLLLSGNENAPVKTEPPVLAVSLNTENSPE